MIDPKKYAEFVNAVTSKESKDYQSFANRIYELEKDGFPTERLLTAAVGLSAEAGEFTEVVKKIIFQGKPVNEDNLFHMKRELGDIMWYWVNACRALKLDPNEVVAENVRKLESRYPGGSFDVYYSENRQQGDL